MIPQRIIVEYDPGDCTIKIAENDFTTFEALGVLEAAKAMINHGWLSEDDKV